MSFKRLNTVLAIGALATLSACGGGGSSALAAQYPLDLAISTFYQMPHSYALAGSSGTDNYALDLGFTPGSQASFDGVQANTATFTVNETKNGAPLHNGTATEYFLTTPFTQLGANNGNTLFELDSGQQALLELTGTGTSGALDSQKYYSDSGFTTQVATGTRTWTLTALTSDTAQFCIDDNDDVGGSPETEIDCYDLDIKGNVTALQITFISGGQSITFK